MDCFPASQWEPEWGENVVNGGKLRIEDEFQANDCAK